MQYNKSKTKYNLKGGEVIDGGSYGCVFNPSLKCSNSDKLHPGLSKLMLRDNGKSELEVVNKIEPLLKNIPNYKNFFILNSFICSPKPLSNTDLKKFDKKCFALTNNNITSRNINKNLNKLQVLQMDNGGISIYNYLNKTYFNKPLFNILNNSYINLLKNGIIPMNIKGVFHNDIKSDNMVYDNKNIRLIDWGEVYLKYKKKNFNQPFQFNLPFSNCLFNEHFIKWYSSQLLQLKKTSNNITFYKYKIIAIKWIYYILELKGGHFEFIKSIFKNILSLELDNNIITYTYVIGYISSYIANILKKYTNLDNNSINLDKYHNEVYIKNIDIWGFLTTYADMVFVYNISPNKFDMSDKDKSILINKLINLLMKYLYSNNYSIKPINTNELMSDLRDLNFSSSIQKLKTPMKTQRKTQRKTPMKTPMKTQRKTQRKTPMKTQRKTPMKTLVKPKTLIKPKTPRKTQRKTN